MRPSIHVWACINEKPVCRIFMKSGYEVFTVGCGAGVSFLRMDAATVVLYLRVLVNFNP
jgi:hypothetical protein